MKKQNILELRERLDEALAVPDLVHEESIRSLIKDQLLRSSFSGTEGDVKHIAEKRAVDVSKFLHMLRSASGKEVKPFEAHGMSHNEWKVKQDTNELRVLYHEGPRGTPFHTLLVEGYVDGPIDVCLCVSWESVLYKKWWPQFNIPTFKIAQSTCLQRVRSGEEINLIRVKVPWPVSDREALLHYFEIEYLKEDLVIVLLNTISDTEQIEFSTHGFTRDGIPEAKEIVRIDLLGGFVIQKVSSNKSYFRTVVNMDIKLDFVPPALINFIARQLIGSGYKLYQKAVATVGTSDEDYREALKGPLYVRLREGLDSLNKHTTLLDMNKKSHAIPPPEESTSETREANLAVVDMSITSKIEESEQSTRLDESHLSNGTRGETPATIASPITNEIEEEESQQSTCLDESHRSIGTRDEIPTAIAMPVTTEIEERSEQSTCLDENQPSTGSRGEIRTITTTATTSEIEEGCEHCMRLDENQFTNGSSTQHTTEEHHVMKERAFISPEVKNALDILDNAIAFVRGHVFFDNRQTDCSSVDHELQPSLAVMEASCIQDSDASEVGSINKLVDEHDDKSPAEDSRCNRVASASREFGRHQGVSSLSGERSLVLGSQHEDGLKTSNGFVLKTGLSMAQLPPVLDSSRKVSNERRLQANGSHETGPNANVGLKKGSKKKRRVCCLSLRVFCG